jgi:hypothetical protein
VTLGELFARARRQLGSPEVAAAGRPPFGVELMFPTYGLRSSRSSKKLCIGCGLTESGVRAGSVAVGRSVGQQRLRIASGRLRARRLGPGPGPSRRARPSYSLGSCLVADAQGAGGARMVQPGASNASAQKNGPPPPVLTACREGADGGEGARLYLRKSTWLGSSSGKGGASTSRPGPRR